MSRLRSNQDMAFLHEDSFKIDRHQQYAVDMHQPDNITIMPMFSFRWPLLPAGRLKSRQPQEAAHFLVRLLLENGMSVIHPGLVMPRHVAREDDVVCA